MEGGEDPQSENSEEGNCDSDVGSGDDEAAAPEAGREDDSISVTSSEVNISLGELQARMDLVAQQR